MRKSLCILCALAAVLSCTKEHFTQERTYAISFDTYAVRTKAGDTFISQSIPDGGTFGVFAYFHPAVSTTQPGSWNDNITGSSNTNRANLMLNQPVTKISPTPDTYTYLYPDQQSRYWPRNPNDRISFFAYYPYAADGFTASGGHTADDTGITLQDPEDDTFGYAHNPVGFPKFRFAVKSNPAEQVDFMLSDMCLDQCKTSSQSVLTGNDGTVMFTFHHMLSQIRVKTVEVITENDKVSVTVDSVRFAGVPVRGIVTPSIRTGSVQPNGHAPMDYTWSGYYTGNEGFRTTIYPDTKLPGETDAEFAARQKAAVMLMIPHTFTERDKIEIYYSITREDSALGEHYTYRNNLITSRLDAGGQTGWERNKIYNYNISFNLNAISFTATVEDWPEASTDVNTIRVDLVDATD